MRSLYIEQKTWLHGVGASKKLFVLAACGMTLTFVNSPVLLACAFSAALLVLLSLGKVALHSLGMLRSLLIACGLIVVLHWLLGSMGQGTESAARLATAGSLALALTLTTRFEALLSVLEKVLGPLRVVGLPVERIALGLGLQLRFVEDFYLQWQRLNEAHRVRTGRAGGLRLIAPLVIRVLSTSERVADALIARLGR